MSATIVWFRQDLRLHDNPALSAAIARGGPVVPVFILDDEGESRWRMGAASRWWLHHSLARLDAALRDRGSQLVLVRGASAAVLHSLLLQTKASAVYWNRRYEPAAVQEEKTITTHLNELEIETKNFNSTLLFDPQAVKNKTGNPFQVFTPFWKHCLTLPIAAPVKLTSASFRPPGKWPTSLELSELLLLPGVKWDAGLEAAWQPGEAEAQKRLKRFLAKGVKVYEDLRDQPGRDGTSALSPYLHFGEIGPRQIWSAVQSLSKTSGVFPPHRGGMVFLKEIGWREFAYHLLCHFPQTPDQPLRVEFAHFPWDNNAKKLAAWHRGATGYPIVDAGMRQLWRTGWMHNRVRMIAASFLVKHLRHSWNEGAVWFWDTLVDADLANNTLGWQWSAGCGADAAPYFRIFNPILQGQKFDPDGSYVRQWVPELAKVPKEFLHRPWEAPSEVLGAAGVVLGKSYPQPIVDHHEARAAALSALKSIRKPGTNRLKK